MLGDLQTLLTVTGTPSLCDELLRLCFGICPAAPLASMKCCKCMLCTKYRLTRLQKRGTPYDVDHTGSDREVSIASQPSAAKVCCTLLV